MKSYGRNLLGSLIINRAIRGCRRWVEDLPYLLELAHGPTRRLVQERIAAAVRNPPTESDWRQYFEDEEPAHDPRP
jgi:hypothetical protein